MLLLLWKWQQAFVRSNLAIFYLEKMPLPFPVLWDEKGAGVRAFQAPNTSYIVILDSAGRVTYTGTGADQDIEAAIRTALRS